MTETAERPGPVAQQQPADPVASPATTEKPLNDEQLAAVTYGGGPLRIIAGAGTGKTQTLTARYRHLVTERGLQPDQVLALTFSDKAAAEMRHRLTPSLPDGHGAPWIMTFHAFCYRLLREWAIDAGTRPPRLDPDGRAFTIRQAIDSIPDHALRAHPGAWGRERLAKGVQTLADRARDNLLGPDEVWTIARERGERSPRLLDLALAYERTCALNRANGVSDFGDLIREVVERLESDPDLLADTRARFQAILVDEFQDTNHAQFRLLQLLAGPGSDLCVVGDPNQAIYAFRGGRSEYMTDFEEHFPGAQTFRLERNYRSRQEILDVANRLIAADPEAEQVVLQAAADSALPGRVTVTEYASPDLEAEGIVRRIRKLASDPVAPVRYADMAILFRSLLGAADPVRRALEGAGIPYRIGKEGVAEWDVIQDILAALRLAAGPVTWLDAARLAARRGANPTRLRLVDAALPNEADRDRLLAGWDGAGVPALEPLGAEIATARAVTTEAQGLATEALPALMWRAMAMTGRMDAGLGVGTTRAMTAMIATATALQERGATPTDLVTQVTAGFDTDEDAAPDAGNGVQLLTVHAAKGLEWPVVFVTGMADRVFPLPMRLDRNLDVDALATWRSDGDEAIDEERAELLREAEFRREERRLAYVALTRAQEELNVTLPRARGEAGLARSPFLAEAGLEPVTGGGPDADDPPATLAEVAQRLRARRRKVMESAPEDGDVADKLAGVLLAEWAAAGELLPGMTPLRLRETPAPNDHESSLKLSYTALSTYETCPRKYLYERILGLGEEAESDHLTFGSAIHEILQALNERWRDTGVVPTQGEVDAEFAARWPVERFAFRRLSEQLRLRGEAMLRRYYAWERENHYQGRRPIAVEEPFELPRGGHLLRGKIDLVIATREGGLEVVDFKTGSASNLRHTKSLQLLIYELAAEHLWPGRPVDSVAFYALRHPDDRGFATGAEWDEKGQAKRRAGGKDRDKLEGDLDKLVAGIVSNDFHPEPSESNCSRCSCAWICPWEQT